MDIHIMIGGAAGQGMDTLAASLGHILAAEGYGVLSTKDYMSRVRGGHNFSILRAAAHTPWAFENRCNLLLCLDEETYSRHLDELDEDGVFVYDPKHFKSDDDRGVAVSIDRLARDAGGRIMANTVALGAALALLGLSTRRAENILLETFSHKDRVGEQNVEALLSGYESVQWTPLAIDPPDPEEQSPIFLDGNQTLGMSAAASGCRFYSAYPMTPATGIMTYLASLRDSEVVVEQPEDEIAAINSVLGASYAGIRAMTATSGGGFSLMVEGLSLAGMTETPAVIVLAMRPGPATGFPTRTDQGDLSFVIDAGHGEFPRVVTSATHLEDAFYRLNKAFALADQFQIPVIFLSDQNFADTARTIPPFDFGKLSHDRYLARELEKPYARYRLAEDGISPRAIPGQFPGEVVLVDSDEHDERGFIVEDASTRRAMMRKRMSKSARLAEAMDEPTYIGPDDPDLLLIGWGSTYGALREARQRLEGQDSSVGHLHFTDLWPLPTQRLEEMVQRASMSICVEANYTAQLADLVRRETGLQFDHSILRYDGRPFTPQDIQEEVAQYV
ncbi:MAG: 2-oxoacid:acceptor oxidoreductase subunit alpha [Bacillota bacterium]